MLRGTIIDELIATVARIEDQMNEPISSVFEPEDTLYSVANQASSATMLAGVA